MLYRATIYPLKSQLDNLTQQINDKIGGRASVVIIAVCARLALLTRVDIGQYQSLAGNCRPIRRNRYGHQTNT